MFSFKGFITKDRNVHLEHLEDDIINRGSKGGENAINFLKSVRDMLAGSSRAKVNMTVKWDGAPAVFAGTDPRDGKFFVAKKGIFNKNPKVYKTDAEVDAFIRLISSTTYTERRILVTRSTEYEESHDKLLRGMWLDLEAEFLSPK